MQAGRQCGGHRADCIAHEAERRVQAVDRAAACSANGLRQPGLFHWRERAGCAIAAAAEAPDHCRGTQDRRLGRQTCRQPGETLHGLVREQEAPPPVAVAERSGEQRQDNPQQQRPAEHGADRDCRPVHRPQIQGKVHCQRALTDAADEPCRDQQPGRALRVVSHGVDFGGCHPEAQLFGDTLTSVYLHLPFILPRFASDAHAQRQRNTQMDVNPAPVSTIPVLDLGPFLAGKPGSLVETAVKLREICETIGFLTIVNHGVSPELMEATFAQAARFHEQPHDIKMQVKVNAIMQGYLPLRGSTTRTSTLSVGSKPNENEAFFVKKSGNDDGGDDRWPADLPGYREAVLRYYEAMDDLAQRLLPLFAAALDLPTDYFAPLCTAPMTTLRMSHYPPATYGANEYGIAPHTDSSFFTLLAQNKVPGLQIRTTSGEWIDAAVVPDSFVVNIGDVLHRWSNGRFLSTPHRAFNTSRGPRYAIPYFFHPNPDTLIDCLPSCSVPGEAPRFEAMTVAEYMAWFRGQNYDHLREKATAA